MLLAPYRVLDLTNRHGMLCAQMLGDLGADVVQIEPRGGASGRRFGPFLDNDPKPENSLSWWSYARGKRSIELDLDADEVTFLKLVERADFLIEAEPVGSLDSRGLTDKVLQECNPALIHVSMTPFGSTGPKALWAASDLTLVASAGPMSLTGDRDRAPLRVSVPQAWLHAASEAAAGALIALHERNHSGLGQHVEVSVQQALSRAMGNNTLSTIVNDKTLARSAGGLINGKIVIRLTYPAKDGHVSVTHLFGAAIGPATRRLMEYVHDEGFCDTATRDKDWVKYGLLLATGKEPIEEFDRVKACVATCLASRTKQELLAAAMERRLLLAPISNIADVVQNEQFVAREYFTRPFGDGPSAAVRYPGPFAKFSATPLAPCRRPPHIGEHTAEILAELGKVRPVSVTGTGGTNLAPLNGVKILDFMWVLAGPGATRMLADYGATVVRVESSTRMDVARTIRPFIDGDPSNERSAAFHNMNAGKLMLTLDLTSQEGHEVILDLVRWADVVTESFSPRAMKAFGLDYETLRKINPDLVMLSSCLMGQTGPYAQFAGFGNLAAAVTGFVEITGWPDRDPAGPSGAYTDFIAPRYNVAAVLAALDHRRRTGEGQYIDLAQAEAALHFLTPAILDYTANGQVQQRLGNRDPHFAPHGVFPAAGEDRHVAIVCETQDQWQALCGVMPALGRDSRFADLTARLKHQDLLDEQLAVLTSTWDAYELELALQAVSVPASVVQNSPELLADPQLTHLGHFVCLPHPEGGETAIESSRIHLSRSPARVDSSAPTFNRNMMDVLKGILDYDDKRIGELLVAGVLE